MTKDYDKVILNKGGRLINFGEHQKKTMAYHLNFRPGTTTKLQNHNPLSSNTDSEGFWALGVLPFATIFPLIAIENGKIPRAFNTVAFLCYLGLEPPIAQQIFSVLAGERHD